MVPISPEIYGAEAVVFDSRRVFDYMQKLQEKRQKEEQALDDALVKYNQDKSNRITETGMSTNDLRAFNKMKDDIQLFFTQNKDKIRKDPMTRYQYDKMWNDLMNLTVESKNKEEEVKPGENLMYSPTRSREVNYDALMPAIDKAKAPIYILTTEGKLERNPDRVPFEFKKEIFLPEVIDYGKTFDENAKGFEGKQKLEETSRKGININIIRGYGEEAVKGIIDNAVNTISQDRGKMSSLMLETKNLTKDNPDVLTNYWEKYTSKFNPKIKPDDPRSLLIGRLAEQAEKRRFADTITDKEAEARLKSGLIEGRKKEGGEGGRIDLTPYPVIDGKKDVSEIFRGVKVTGLPTGAPMEAKQVLYDKNRNEVTITEWVSRDVSGNPIGGKTKTLPYSAFLQNIKTMNPGTDFKFIETLPAAKDEGRPVSPKGFTMKQEDFRKLSILERQAFLQKGGIVK